MKISQPKNKPSLVTNRGWISVKDKLPSLGDRVLIFTRNGAINIARFSNYNTAYGTPMMNSDFTVKDPWFCNSKSTHYAKKTILYWMKLPIKPPIK